MAKKSASTGPDSAIQFAKLDLPPPHVAREQRKMADRSEGVSISLKYYRQEAECFSDWARPELKKFTAVIEKMKQLNAFELRTQFKLCTQHKRKPKADRYSRPADLSDDLDMFEIRVDTHNKARIHGVIVGSVFHLVWLDRDHRVFPQ